jgi:regulatory protein
VAKRQAPDPDSAQAAWVEALRMLAGRELPAAGVRQRLQRRGFTAAAADQAIARLLSSGTIDDSRVARAVAQSRARVKRQGRSRVLRELTALGIASDVADEAVADVFDNVDEGALLAEALERRLRGAASLADPAVRRRVVAGLVRQGFAPDAVLRAVKGRSRQG